MFMKVNLDLKNNSVLASFRDEKGKIISSLELQQIVNMGPGFTDDEYRNQGLMFKLMQFLKNHYNLKNFYILAENDTSAHLAEKFGLVERKDLRIFEKRES